MEIERVEIYESEDEIKQTRVWQSSAMIGKWYGHGMWNGDKKWKGNGYWEGGSLLGNWNGMGEWEIANNGKGKWRGNGDLKSSMKLKKHPEFLLFIVKRLIIIAAIELIAVATIGFSLSWWEISGGSIGRGLIIIAGGFVFIALLSLVAIALGGRETYKGEWQGEGTWEDYGNFRILNLSGKWKLGYHTGTLRGKMIDPKPDNDGWIQPKRK